MRLSWKWCLPFGVLILPFVYSAFFTFPGGDDFDRANTARYIFDVYKAVESMGWSWWVWSGRYTHHFLVIFFGDAVWSRLGYAAVCLGVMGVYFLGMFGIFRELTGRREYSTPFVLALVGMLTFFAGHESLNLTYYLVTDALGLGIGNGIVLIFIWSLTRIWFCPHVEKRDVVFAVASGGIGIGCYEHAAVAIFITGCTGAALAFAYDHKHKAVFWKIAKWILFFFLLSFLARGNFRRQTKRSVSFEEMLANVQHAGIDWFKYSFIGFGSVFPVMAVLLARICPASWGQSFQKRWSLIWVLGGGLVVFIGVSGAIVLVHAMSDVTIGEASKLPASVGLLSAYIMLGVALGCRESLQKCLGWLPKGGALALAVLILVLSPNIQKTWIDTVSGTTALFGAEQARRFDVLMSHQGMNVSVCPLLTTAYPATSFGDPIPTHSSQWPNKQIRKMYGLKGLQSVLPQKEKVLEQIASRPLEEAQYAEYVPDVQAGPNESYLFDWLVFKPETPIQTLSVFTVTKNTEDRPVPEWLTKTINEVVLAKDSFEMGGIEQLAGVRRTFTGTSWQDETSGAWVVPVNVPGAADVVGVYVSGDGVDFGCVYRGDEEVDS